MDGVAAAECVGPTEINYRVYAFSENRHKCLIQLDGWEDSKLPSLYDASVLKNNKGRGIKKA